MSGKVALDDDGPSSRQAILIMQRRFDTGVPPERTSLPRKSARVAVDAEVTLRRPGHNNFPVRVYDASRHGCKVEFVERPRVDDRIWIKFDGLEALQGYVCWVDGFIGGVEFEKPIHSAVFDMLLSSLR